MIRFTPLILVAAVVCGLFGGCSKSATEAPKSLDLGEIELTLGTPSRYELGGGNTCVLRAESLGPGTIELVAILEKSGKETASARVLPATVGRPMNLSLGNYQLQLTPRIAR